MADITAIRAALATNLTSITGLRTNATVPDNVNPPYAIISLDTVDYHKAFANGLNTYNFVATVIVGRASERSAQNTLDAYCSPTGSKSIKQGIELDRTLGGLVYDLTVSGMRNYGSTTINENLYLAAEFDLTVQAN